MKANYLICYDIADDRRLARTFKFLKQYGIHIQYSVFYCKLTWEELKKVKTTLQGIIDEKHDDIRIYPLPSELETIVLGCGDRLPDGVNIFL